MSPDTIIIQDKTRKNLTQTAFVDEQVMLSSFLLMLNIWDHMSHDATPLAHCLQNQNKGPIENQRAQKIPI